MESQDLKATYRKIFKANLIQICHSNQAYIKDCKLQKKLKMQLDSILRFHKLHSKRPIHLLFYPRKMPIAASPLCGARRRHC